MNELMDVIIGNSTTLDVYVVVRVVVLCMILELFAVACAMLGNMGRR